LLSLSVKKNVSRQDRQGRQEELNLPNGNSQNFKLCFPTLAILAILARDIPTVFSAPLQR
jgi:hypothetical protein